MLLANWLVDSKYSSGHRERHKKIERIFGLYKGSFSFTNCSIPPLSRVKQVYHTTCLLGCETDTYDSEGARVRVAPWRHVTREQVEGTLARFSGEIEQTPPMSVFVHLMITFSAKTD
jgi:TruB family pseudouridylate synthase (N terminal domain)